MENCIICKQPFEPRHNKHVRCSNCKGLEEKNCLMCNEPFISKAQNQVSYCLKCRTNKRTCLSCGKEFTPNPRAKVIAGYCSEKCRMKPAYERWYTKKKPKKDMFNKYTTAEHVRFSKIAKVVMESQQIPRECVRCSNTENLHIHHKDLDRANNLISNLEYLCDPCHREVHVKIRKKMLLKEKVLEKTGRVK